MNGENYPRNWHNVPTGQLLGLVIDWAAKINEKVAGWEGAISNVRKLLDAVWPLAPDGERVDRFDRIEDSIEQLAVCRGFAQRLQAVEENHAKLWAEVMQSMPKRLGRFGGRLEALEERIKHPKITVKTPGEFVYHDGHPGLDASTPPRPSDPINPNHYKHPTRPNVECIQFSEHMGYHLGQAFAYAWRVYLGGQALSLCAQDLKKARWYVKRYLALDPGMTCEHPLYWRNRGAISDYGVIMTGLYDATSMGDGNSRKSLLGSLIIDLDRAIDVFEDAAKSGIDPRKIQAK